MEGQPNAGPRAHRTEDAGCPHRSERRRAIGSARESRRAARVAGRSGSGRRAARPQRAGGRGLDRGRGAAAHRPRLPAVAQAARPRLGQLPGPLHALPHGRHRGLPAGLRRRRGGEPPRGRARPAHLARVPGHRRLPRPPCARHRGRPLRGRALGVQGGQPGRPRHRLALRGRVRVRGLSGRRSRRSSCATAWRCGAPCWARWPCGSSGRSPTCRRCASPAARAARTACWRRWRAWAPSPTPWRPRATGASTAAGSPSCRPASSPASSCSPRR